MPEATHIPSDTRRIAEAVAEVHRSHTSEWFVGLIVFGSAVKGGVIRGCSDIDFQLFLQDAAFDADGSLPLPLALSIHRDLAVIDPAPFRYIQCTPFSTRLPDGYVGPVPGTYSLIAGDLPVPEATPEQLRTSARAALASIDTDPTFLKRGLLDHGGGRLSADVRLLCTKVWPILYAVLTVQEGDAIQVWQLTKDEAVERLPADGDLRSRMLAFYQAVLAYYPDELDLEMALRMIGAGTGFLGAVRTWWACENR